MLARQREFEINPYAGRYAGLSCFTVSCYAGISPVFHAHIFELS